MSIKASELPELIAAAVRKAVADKAITDQQLTSLLHHPITIGIIARPEVGIKQTKVAAAEHIPAVRTLGYQLATLDKLRDVQHLKAVVEE